MEIDKLCEQILNRNEGRSIIINSASLAESVVSYIRTSGRFDDVIETSKVSSSAILNLLKPTMAHGSGMGQRKSIVLVFRDLEDRTGEEISQIRTRYDTGSSDFSSTRHSSSLDIYVDARDLEKYKDLSLFSPDRFFLLEEDGLKPLMRDDELVPQFIRALKKREVLLSLERFHINIYGNNYYDEHSDRYYDRFSIFGFGANSYTNQLLRTLGLYDFAKSRVKCLPNECQREFKAYSEEFECRILDYLKTEIERKEKTFYEKLSDSKKIFSTNLVPEAKEGLILDEECLKQLRRAIESFDLKGKAETFIDEHVGNVTNALNDVKVYLQQPYLLRLRDALKRGIGK